MAKPYQLLRNKMSPESRKRAQELARQLREEMRLVESSSSGNGLPETHKLPQRQNEPLAA